MKKTVFVVGGDTSYFKFLDNSKFELTNNIENSDILLFTGGEDVTPSLYGHKNLASYANLSRDRFESEIYIKYGINKNCIGICRGLKL
jgi:gamma-glutamyl-gamma-aminobutyrate hydrolase PuuD